MSPIKPTIKTEIIPLLLLAAVAVSSLYFYNHFPERVPSHWNFKGEIDGWSGKAGAAFGLPAILVLMYLMFLVIPYLDPRKEKYQQFAKVYHIFKTSILSLLGLLYFAVGINGIGYPINIGLWTPVVIGLLFIILGNYMGKIKSNWFVGIRTPWTLSSEEVWNKTHRFGGKIFILAGIGMILQPFLPENFRLPLFIITITAMLLGTFGYSYFIYKKKT